MEDVIERLMKKSDEDIRYYILKDIDYLGYLVDDIRECFDESHLTLLGENLQKLNDVSKKMNDIVNVMKERKLNIESC